MASKSFLGSFQTQLHEIGQGIALLELEQKLRAQETKKVTHPLRAIQRLQTKLATLSSPATPATETLPAPVSASLQNIISTPPAEATEPAAAAQPLPPQDPALPAKKRAPRAKTKTPEEIETEKVEYRFRMFKRGVLTPADEKEAQLFQRLLELEPPTAALVH